MLRVPPAIVPSFASWLPAAEAGPDSPTDRPWLARIVPVAALWKLVVLPDASPAAMRLTESPCSTPELSMPPELPRATVAERVPLAATTPAEATSTRLAPSTALAVEYTLPPVIDRRPGV